jgi:hypothetical protein
VPSVLWLQMTKESPVCKDRDLKKFASPNCSVCERPVELEISKADEFGKAVHEECCVLKVKQRTANLFPLCLMGDARCYTPHAKEPLP